MTETHDPGSIRALEAIHDVAKKLSLSTSQRSRLGLSLGDLAFQLREAAAALSPPPTRAEDTTTLRASAPSDVGERQDLREVRNDEAPGK